MHIRECRGLRRQDPYHRVRANLAEHVRVDVGPSAVAVVKDADRPVEETVRQTQVMDRARRTVKPKAAARIVEGRQSLVLA